MTVADSAPRPPGPQRGFNAPHPVTRATLQSDTEAQVPHPEPPAAGPKRFAARTRGLRGAPEAAVPGVPRAARETPRAQTAGPRLGHSQPPAARRPRRPHVAP